MAAYSGTQPRRLGHMCSVLPEASGSLCLPGGRRLPTEPTLPPLSPPRRTVLSAALHSDRGAMVSRSVARGMSDLKSRHSGVETTDHGVGSGKTEPRCHRKQ